MQQNAAHITNKGDASEHRSEPDTQSHIAIQDVAELVPDDPLKLIPVERCQCATRHRYNGIGRTGTRREGVNPGLFVQYKQ